MRDSRLQTVVVVFAFLVTCDTLLADESVELNSAQDPSGKKFLSYSVSSDVLRKQPSWDPASQDVPLSAKSAVKIATAWLFKQPRASKDQKCSTVSMSCYPQFNNTWVYMIHFTTRYDTERWWEIPNTVIVLLDGSVVEPKRPLLDKDRSETPNNAVEPTRALSGASGSP